MACLETHSEREYCNYYKFMLIEEILFSAPGKCHYGKCCVPGKIIFESNKYFLENIQIISLPKKYQLPSSLLKMPLILTAYSYPLPTGKSCEIYGEISPSEECPVKQASTRVLKCSENLQMGQNRILPDNNNVYKHNTNVGILLHSVHIVDQVQELIECNLTLRSL